MNFSDSLLPFQGKFTKLLTTWSIVFTEGHVKIPAMKEGSEKNGFSGIVD